MDKPFLLAVAVGFLSPLSFARADKYFDAGAAVSKTWDTATQNWANSPSGPFNASAWTDYEFAVFQGGGDTVTISGTAFANGLTFLADNYVITGGTLQTGSPVGGTLINIGAGLTTTIASNISMTSFGFSKTGAGSLNLTGTVAASAYPIKVTGGLLKVTGSGRLFGGNHSTGSVTVSGGTLELDTWNYAFTGSSLGGLSSGAGSVVIDGGTIRVNGTTSYGRGVTLNGAATLEAASGANWTIDTVHDSTAWIYNNRSITLTGAGNGTFQKVFSGTGALTKSGTGTWTLSGANTHTGGMMINGGTLVTAVSSGALGAGAVTLGGGTLQVGAANITGITALTVNTGTLDTAAGAITTTGAFSLAGGTWKIGATANGVAAAAFALTAGAIDISALLDKTTGANGFSLIAGAGTVNTGGLSFIGGDAGYAYAVNTSGDLIVTAIPEPAGYGLLGAGSLTLLAVARRRRHVAR